MNNNLCRNVLLGDIDKMAKEFKLKDEDLGRIAQIKFMLNELDLPETEEDDIDKCIVECRALGDDSTTFYFAEVQSTGLDRLFYMTDNSADIQGYEVGIDIEIDKIHNIINNFYKGEY